MTARPPAVGDDGPVTPTVAPLITPLIACALDTERHVARSGWDQPIRLFALVSTATLLESEPALAAQIPQDERGGFTAIEQDELPSTSSVEELLGPMAWPEQVEGVAIAVERIVVPPEAERDLPADPGQALEALAGHPDRADVRLLAAVLRDGEQVTLLRQRAHDRDEDVAMGAQIAPGLVEALAATLR